MALYIARRELVGLDRERLLAIYLNAQCVVMGLEVVSIGAESAACATMTTIFRGAVMAGAKQIILAHNHPSGVPAPSAEDRELLEKVRQSGEVLDCRLLDFLIIGEGGLYSDKDSIEAGKDHA